MLILGIDSSSKSASAAVFDSSSGKLLSEINSGGTLSHSENLMPMIDYALKTAGVSVNDIDLFSVASGPGSFTGIRIAVATIKGLAFAENSHANCVSVSSLCALAYNFAGLDLGVDLNDTMIFPVIDARRRQVYNAIFKLNAGEPQYITADRLVTIDELMGELEQYTDKAIIFTGDAANICYEELKFDGRKIKAPNILKRTSGYAICVAALHEYNKNGAISANALAPAYLVKTQAERELME